MGSLVVEVVGTKMIPHSMAFMQCQGQIEALRGEEWCQYKIHSYEPELRCLLYCLLISDNYRISVIEQSHKITKDKIRQRYFPCISDDGLEDFPDEITETRDRVRTFISEEDRHDVMYAFVTECLVKDSDLEFFLTTASRDVIYEYCRHWDYKRDEGERCLYIPDWPGEMYDLFIDKLQLDIITHCTMSDRWIHYRISKCLEVPTEVLKWDQKARERYVEYARRGTQTVHHARGMIVGCAGAGKTTLLKRLLGCSEEEIKKVKSTEGLEVHEEIFDICNETKSFKARSINKGDLYEERSATHMDSKTLTFFDFGGQCAYYACHQIYLTKRAFYVVVVDASKRLDQKVDKEVCDQDGSVFSEWTYGDYFVFWIKSIHTYCGPDNENDAKPVVLIVATHWEEGNKQFKDKDVLMESLRLQFPKSSYLPQYIIKDNCFCTQLSVSLEDLERRLFDIASQQQWKETIPKEWSFFEIEISQTKHSKRIIKISDILTKTPNNSSELNRSATRELDENKDMLRYFHDAGKVLHFEEKGLTESVIIDVQWFVDSFKHIITDKLHFEGIPVTGKDWEEYYKTGNLKNELLIEIWKHKDRELFERLKKENKIYEIRYGSFKRDERYLEHHEKSLLNFMQRLGLLAVGEKSHYVPCMNRKEMEASITDLIQSSESKTSVLIYQFPFLPFFLFYRLIVACVQDGWMVLETDGTSSLYRNVALFSVLDYHVILSVTEESIQLQVFHPNEGCILERHKTERIQEKVENILNDCALKRLRQPWFVKGFRCRMDNTKAIAMDITDHFLSQDRISKDVEKIICPLHSLIDKHYINTNELTRYWKLEM